MSRSSTMSPTLESPASTEIAARAHEIWLAEGCPEGRDVEHWLKAEAQIKTENEFSSRQTQRRERETRLGSVKTAL